MLSLLKESYVLSIFFRFYFQPSREEQSQSSLPRMSGHRQDPAPQEVHHHVVRAQRELRGKLEL